MAYQYQSGAYNSGGAWYYDPDTSKFKVVAPPHSVIVSVGGGAGGADQPVYNDQPYTISQMPTEKQPSGVISGGNGSGESGSLLSPGNWPKIQMQPGTQFATAPVLNSNRSRVRLQPSQGQPAAAPQQQNVAPQNQVQLQPSKPQIDLSLQNWLQNLQ